MIFNDFGQNDFVFCCGLLIPIAPFQFNAESTSQYDI
jgi:hypothetical protein